MKHEKIMRWVAENADAPPPPSNPCSLPDDTVSTVYPESSVSNPNASRYTGRRHRSPFASSRATYPPATFLERRPSSAQALYRDQQPPTIRSRFHSVSASADARYAGPQPQPFVYAYTHSKSNSNPNYYAPASAHYPHNRAHSPTRAPYVPAQHSVQQPAVPYRVVSPSPSPHRVESRSADTVRPQYTTYAAYHSTPTLALQSRSSTPKKPPLLRRIFGNLDWGLAPAKTYSSQQQQQQQQQHLAQQQQHPPIQQRSTSRSSAKTISHSRSSDRVEATYKPMAIPTSRNRIHPPDNIVYVRG